MTTRGESGKVALEHQFEHDWRTFELSTLRRLLKSQARRALCFGCGPAFDLRGLLRDGLAKEGAACDQSLGQLSLAKDTFRGQESPLLISWDGSSRLPKQYGSFDLVYVRLVLQHVDGEKDILTILHNLLACLDPGGYIVVHDGDRTQIQAMIDLDLDDRVRAIEETVATYQRDQLKRFPDAGARLAGWLNSAGFAVTEEVDTLDLPVLEENRVVVDLRSFVAEDKGLRRLRCVSGTKHKDRLMVDVFAELREALEQRLMLEPNQVYLRTKKARHIVAARRPIGAA